MIDDGRWLALLATLGLTVGSTALRGSRGIARSARVSCDPRFLDGTHGFLIYDADDPREGLWTWWDRSRSDWAPAPGHGRKVQIRDVDVDEAIVVTAVNSSPKIWRGELLAADQLAERYSGSVLEHLLAIASGLRATNGSRGVARAARLLPDVPLVDALREVLRVYPPIVSATVCAFLIEDERRRKSWQSKDIRQPLEGEGLPDVPMYGGPAGLRWLVDHTGADEGRAVRLLSGVDQGKWYDEQPIPEQQPVPGVVFWLARQVRAIVADASPASLVIPPITGPKKKVSKLTPEFLSHLRQLPVRRVRTWGSLTLSGDKLHLFDAHDLSVHVRIGRIWEKWPQIVARAEEDPSFLAMHDWKKATAKKSGSRGVSRAGRGASAGVLEAGRIRALAEGLTEEAEQSGGLPGRGEFIYDVWSRAVRQVSETHRFPEFVRKLEDEATALVALGWGNIRKGVLTQKAVNERLEDHHKWPSKLKSDFTLVVSHRSLPKTPELLEEGLAAYVFPFLDAEGVRDVEEYATTVAQGGWV